MSLLPGQPTALLPPSSQLLGPPPWLVPGQLGILSLSVILPCLLCRLSSSALKCWLSRGLLNRLPTFVTSSNTFTVLSLSSGCGLRTYFAQNDLSIFSQTSPSLCIPQPRGCPTVHIVTQACTWDSCWTPPSSHPMPFMVQALHPLPLGSLLLLLPGLPAAWSVFKRPPLSLFYLP